MLSGLFEFGCCEMYLRVWNAFQVVMVNRRLHINTVPEDISTCHGMSRPQLPQLTPIYDPDEVGSEDPHQQFMQKLREKFFPHDNKPPPAFFKEIFDLVANTCSVPTCKIDNVIDLLERAYHACTVFDDDYSNSLSESICDDDYSIPPSESVSDRDDDSIPSSGRSAMHQCDIGLVLVHESPIHSADVVFVHGLGGHLIHTWETISGEFWLKWLGGRLPQIRVWSFGYNAHMVSGSQDVFHVYATQFLREMSSHLSVHIYSLIAVSIFILISN